MARLADILDGENSKAIPIIVILAIVFHILVLIIVPYFLSLQWKPKILSRPPTFELVQLQPQPPARRQPTPPAPKPVAETPQPTPVEPQPPAVVPPKPNIEKKIEPKKEDPKKPIEQPKSQPQTQPVEAPKPKVVEEDISDLEDLFADTPAPAISNVSVQISEPFPYQWYLDQLQARIKNRWKPAANEKGEVVVQFTITRNGSLEGLKLVSSSGRAILDRQALQAVEMSAPFASLPQGFQGQSLGVVLTLKPQR
jgi:protein TonB